MSAEARTKSYPENYPSDAMAILDAMSFSNGKEVKVLGSMSLRSQQYAGDYDAYEVVKRNGTESDVLDDLADEFKAIVKRLLGMKNVFVGDIKAGCVEEWRVIPHSAGLKEGKLVGYNAVECKRKVDELYRAKVITEGEKKSAEELLKSPITPEEFLIARKKIKFHIIRWSPSEVQQGSKVLRDKRRFTLQEAFSSPSITKLDTIGFVQNNKYTDFSIIYEFHNGKKVLNPSFEDIGRSLSEDIIFYKNENNPFKVLKREFALAKFRGDDATIKKLTPILNSDLGRLYSMLSDVGTMIMLLEEKKDVPMAQLRFEIDQFKARMANVWELDDFIKAEHGLLARINSATKTTNKATLLTHLKEIEKELQSILTKNTPKKLIGGAIDMPSLPEIQAEADVVDKKKVAFDLQAKLRQASHYYANRSPATAYGLRVLSDEIWKQVPRLDGKPERALDKGHQDFSDTQGTRVLTGYTIPSGYERGFKTEPFADIYKKRVAPVFAKIAADKDPDVKAEYARVSAIPRYAGKPAIDIWGKVLEDNPNYR